MKNKNLFKCFVILFTLIFIIVGGTGVISFAERSVNDNYIIYLKDGKVYLYNHNASKSDFLYDFSEVGRDYAYFEKDYRLKFTKNGNRVFYLKNFDDMDYIGTLCYRDIDEENKNGREIKISDNVVEYKISSNGNKVLYSFRGEGYAKIIYEFDLEKNEKKAVGTVSEMGYNFDVSSDGNRIIYKDFYGRIIEKSVGLDKQVLVYSGEYPELCSDDIKQYYYIDNGILYKKEFGKNKEKVDSNVSEIIKVYENGEIYYEKEKEEFVKLQNFLEDDMKESNLKSQNIDDVDYENLKEYRKKFVQNSGVGVTRYMIYYFDGKVKNKVSDWVTEQYDDMKYFTNPNEYLPFGIEGYWYKVNHKTPAIVFEEFDYKSKEKYRLSESLGKSYSVSGVEYSLIRTMSKTKFAIGGKVLGANFEGGEKGITDEAFYSKNGKTVYLYNSGNLYRGNMENNNSINLELMYKDENIGNIKVDANGDVYQSSTEKIYKTKQDDTIVVGEGGVIFPNKNIYYSDQRQNEIILLGNDIESKNFSELFKEIILIKKKSDTLEIAHGGDNVVGDMYDGRRYILGAILKNGDVVLLKEYNEETYIGDMYLYTSNGQRQLIAKEVELLATY